MEMSLDDIRKEYRTAKDRKEQIKILAQLNETTPRVILEMLHDAGEAVDMRWYNRPKRAQKAETPEQPAEIQAEKKVEPLGPLGYITSGALIEILYRFEPGTPVMLAGEDELLKVVTFVEYNFASGEVKQTIYLGGE